MKVVLTAGEVKEALLPGIQQMLPKAQVVTGIEALATGEFAVEVSNVLGEVAPVTEIPEVNP